MDPKKLFDMPSTPGENDAARAEMEKVIGEALTERSRSAAEESLKKKTRAEYEKKIAALPAWKRLTQKAQDIVTGNTPEKQLEKEKNQY